MKKILFDPRQPLSESVRSGLGRHFKATAVYSLVHPSAVGRRHQQGYRSIALAEGSLGEEFIIMEAPNVRKSDS